jgi:hypothetical protein
VAASGARVRGRGHAMAPGPRRGSPIVRPERLQADEGQWMFPSRK